MFRKQIILSNDQITSAATNSDGKRFRASTVIQQYIHFIFIHIFTSYMYSVQYVDKTSTK